MKPILGLPEIAQITGMKYGTVARWRTEISGRELPPPDDMIGNTPWWWSATIYRWIERTPGITVKHRI